MRTIRLAGLHIAVLPMAVLLALALGLASARLGIPREAIDIHLHDTMFVIAHFHLSILLGCLVFVSTLVAYRCQSMNLLLAGAWACLGAGTIAAALPWGGPIQPALVPGDGIFVRSSAPPLASAYVWSSILGFGVCVLGLIASFVIALRRGMRPAQR